MGSQELLDYLRETMKENPVLEGEDRESGGEREEDALLRRKLEWLAASDHQNRWYHREDARDLTDALPGTVGADPGEESLYRHLWEQIDFSSLSREMARGVELVLASLNGNGWLDEPLDGLARQGELPLPVMEDALALVQTLDPPGVGGRGLSECLALQLRRKGETGLALTVAEHYLEEMAKAHYNLIARETGATREEISRACREIRSLDPRPGSSYSPRELPGYVTPDLVVVKFSDHFELLSNDYFFPTLKLSSYYRQLMGDTEDPTVRDYLTEKVKQARWVMRSVEQRRSTLLSCAGCILERQEAFFRLGPGHLRPLTLADVAGELEVHESTVSRAVKDKYLQCVYGVFPLSYFFSRAVPAAGGETVSAERAKAVLRSLIEGEEGKPLSDRRLTELLEEQGIALSRRTVAKYREEMGIPSASGRKELHRK